MKLGIFGINAGRTIGPGPTARLAGRCEELGYESWWVGEHVVLPSPRVAPSPMRPTDPILDPLVHLAYVAGATERMLLGTGIIIVPQRNPLVLAKQIATLDVLSGGRFVFGVGVGYLEPELTAIGVPMTERASRTDDYLAAMRALWYEDGPVHFDGPHTTFADIEAYPKPAGVIPIVVGGRTSGAHRRSIEQGNGWYGFFLSPDDSAEQVRLLGEAAKRFERPPELGELEISITPAEPLTPDLLKAYEDAGVHRLIVYPATARDEAEAERFISEHAELVIG